MLSDDSYRTGIAHSPMCECGFERESVEHFPLHCIRFQDARNKMIDTVNEIFDLSAHKRPLQLSENLLLAPMSVGVNIVFSVNNLEGFYYITSHSSFF